MGHFGISTHDLTCDVLFCFQRICIFIFKWGTLEVYQLTIWPVMCFTVFKRVSVSISSSNGSLWDINSWYDLWCVLPFSNGIFFQLQMRHVGISTHDVTCDVFCSKSIYFQLQIGYVGISTHDWNCDVFCSKSIHFQLQMGHVGISNQVLAYCFLVWSVSCLNFKGVMLRLQLMFFAGWIFPKISLKVGSLMVVSQGKVSIPLVNIMFSRILTTIKLWVRKQTFKSAKENNTKTCCMYRQNRLYYNREQYLETFS